MFELHPGYPDETTTLPPADLHLLQLLCTRGPSGSCAAWNGLNSSEVGGKKTPVVEVLGCFWREKNPFESHLTKS